MRLTTIVGARPQFIKAAAVSKAIVDHNANNDNKIIENIIHTGQHYDERMSSIFFEELKIPKPTKNLKLGGGTHGQMTGEMLKAIEEHLIDSSPDMLLVYGDTNSTLAGALAAAKLHIPVAHVEAGLRSFNRQMPEEINRVLTDHVSTLLFCPTTASVTNLHKEGITKGVHPVGDVMYDATLAFTKQAESQSKTLRSLNLSASSFIFATIHRAENTDNNSRLAEIVSAINELSSNHTIVLPIHPRTDIALTKHQLKFNKDVLIIPPTSYLDTQILIKNAIAVLTDSGGMQKEAYFHKTECITLRDETEWIETVTAGWNQLAGASKNRILESLKATGPSKHKKTIDEYGTGNASIKILSHLLEHCD
ncbi:UDP-N-acetylglucosamine 2-epimerase (non-hydrolyzing) [Pelagicoccus sp. SDUM812005]|uniref:non-hydrolyzing UDP-N-acetylglucosamine 2-epimerase n=1 Tax=Pelagicoccus sp. SDUM812005 TaxID=3041257 RepID=UPI00280F5C83|nr:UDP-N-acetylglucosamine 2-epimerase (non-hydrolyzing) [Pelagicoccus sp. SDUM812005]MDQ8180813.1 UDP-N-acetylglucosamine 2-epimerase (non-hydrolyzing) [Pelagicoccus sp. SDUM812005]